MFPSSDEKYRNLIKEAQQLADDNVVDVNERQVQLMFFSVGGYPFALHGSNIREILHIGQITTIPGVSELFLGVINIRGEIDSVLHLSRLLGCKPFIQTPKSRIAIAVLDGIRTGIAVDSVDNIIDVAIRTLDHHVASLNEPVRSLACGQVSFENQIVPLLDLKQIYSRLA
ncbi:MAG: Chemotaxis signal transduction protein [Magnetococcales bacterium]|nr:Chemotaxis signal transduction protein [Magnetococcales bacterium]